MGILRVIWMRLDKYVSKATGLSRRDAKRIILKGRVRVGGEVVKDPSFHVENEEVSIDDEVLKSPKEKIYLVLNKPPGFVTSTRGDQPTVFDLVDHPKVRELHAVRRLDKDSRGMLILTNDGEFTHRVISRKSHVEKEYEVVVEGNLSRLGELLEGVDIGGEKVKALKVGVVSEGKVRIVIDEGRYHQVKRMLRAVGLKVIDLKRVRIGKLTLDVPEGEWRELSEREIRRVLK